MTQTTNYGFTLFDSTDKPKWLRDWNENFNKVDEVIAGLEKPVIPEQIMLTDNWGEPINFEGNTFTPTEDGIYAFSLACKTTADSANYPATINIGMGTKYLTMYSASYTSTAGTQFTQNVISPVPFKAGVTYTLLVFHAEFISGSALKNIQ